MIKCTFIGIQNSRRRAPSKSLSGDRSRSRSKHRRFQGHGICGLCHFRKQAAFAILFALVCFVASDRNVVAAGNEACSRTLEQVAGRGFQEDSLGTFDDSACPADIWSYVSFVGFVLASNGTSSKQELRDRLLSSAESNYLSARIICTLVFDGPFATRFGDDVFVEQSYSRYTPYIVSLRLLGQWKRDRIVDKLFVANQFANDAVRQGVVEAHMLRHGFNYAQYKGSKNEAFKKDAAVSFLIIAFFLNETEAARKYLIESLDLNRAELESSESDARNAITRILVDPENSACRQNGECVLGLNLKRVICDIRDRSGQLLLRIEEQSCLRLSEPLIGLYRPNVKYIFDGFISGTNP